MKNTPATIVLALLLAACGSSGGSPTPAPPSLVVGPEVVELVHPGIGYAEFFPVPADGSPVVLPGWAVELVDPALIETDESGAQSAPSLGLAFDNGLEPIGARS